MKTQIGSTVHPRYKGITEWQVVAIAELSDDLSDSDILALWEAGANGVVLWIKPEQLKERLPGLHQVIKALPTTVKRRPEQQEALLPPLG